MVAWRDLLDPEESFFRLLVAAGRRFKRAPSSSGGSTAEVVFEERARSLSVLAQLLTGAAVRVRSSPGVGGLRGSDLLLPTAMSLGSDMELNREAYRVQVVVLSGMWRLTRAERAPLATRYEQALEALEIARNAVDLMAAELPGFRCAHDRVMARVLSLRAVDLARLPEREASLEQARRAALAGERPWLDPALRARLVGARTGRRQSPPLPIWGEWLEAPSELEVGSPTGDSAQAEPPTSEIEAPGVAALRRIDLDPQEDTNPPPAAPFERAETLDSYRGGRRDLDGMDELESHLEALEEVELGDLVRSNQTTQSLLRADLELGADVGDAAAEDDRSRGIAYDEWDARTRSYRKAWCTVYPAEARSGDARWSVETLQAHRVLVRRLRQRLEAYRSGLRAAPRQLDGEEIDLAAALDERVALRAGRGGDPRLYVRQRKRRRDFATLVLLDVSMSTDSWVEGRRILDVAREATLVLGEVADELGDRLQVLAFASETRNRCDVWKVLGEGESWSQGKRRLAALVPTGYTRIGPALRHATALLSATPAERRLLLLISDGKPTDYDRYEGRYGIGDVRQAIREARDHEIDTHALAVDAVARDYLPALFGDGGWHILSSPDQLVESLTAVYGRLTAR